VASVTGAGPCVAQEPPELDCRDSLNSLRLLLPLALALRGGAIFRGQERVLKAGLGSYRSLLRKKGIQYDLDNAGLSVQGLLQHGIYRIRGDVSPHCVNGLLFALPLLNGISRLDLVSPLRHEEPTSQVMDILHAYGIAVKRHTWFRFTVLGGQHYTARDSRVEGDYGLAAFFYAAQGMGNLLDIQGIDPHSRRTNSIIRRLSARLCDPGTVHIDASQHPDLVPAIAAQAALREGETTHIVEAGSLRTRAGDHLGAIARELRAIGATIEEFPEHLTVHGVDSLPGGKTRSGGDPRIVMMLAVAATCSTGPISIAGAECVDRLYPDFWKEYARLGGSVRLTA